jgi:predicted enzyme related to lactoylglutathione lyase
MAKRNLAAATLAVECVIPILNVTSPAASTRFYVEVLGCTVDWGGDDASEMASVSRNGHAIMLCQGAQGQPGTWLWIGVDDLAPRFAQYMMKGARVRQPPTNRPWAYETQIEDPDGHVLRFGSEPLADHGVTR